MRATNHAPRARRAAALMALAATACTGSVDGADRGGPTAPNGGPPGATTTGTGATGTRPQGTTPGGGPAGPGAASPGATGESAGVLPFRRLTRDELNHTLRDLLGDTTTPAAALDADATGGSGFYDPGLVASNDAKTFDDLADGAARRALARPPSILPCDPQAAGETPCARQFVRTFGARVYRRPLADDEAARLDAVYDAGRMTLKYGFDDAIRMVLTTMLESPNFLYHWELSRPSATGAQAPLDAYALASRLSYFLWQSMPDAALFKAAADGSLTTPATLEMHARRMLQDPKARAAVESFFVQWLEVQTVAQAQRDPRQYKDFTPAAAAAMLGEATAFADQAFLGAGTLDTLYRAPYSFVDANLAKLYGVPPPGGTDLKMSMLPQNQRRGFLTQLAFLTMYPAGAPTHPPVQRGKHVYNKVLCGDVAPPGMVPMLMAPPPGLPLRQHFAAHATQPVCAACHHLLDPIGFAFESYDSVGKYRAVDDLGQPVDASGSLPLPLSGARLDFANALELIDGLAASADARDCLATQWLRFALGRADGDDDHGSLAAAQGAFLQARGDFRELLVAIARSKTFTSRKPKPGENTP